MNLLAGGRLGRAWISSKGQVGWDNRLEAGMVSSPHHQDKLCWKEKTHGLDVTNARLFKTNMLWMHVFFSYLVWNGLLCVQTHCDRHDVGIVSLREAVIWGIPFFQEGVMEGFFRMILGNLQRPNRRVVTPNGGDCKGIPPKNGRNIQVKEQ